MPLTLTSVTPEPLWLSAMVPVRVPAADGVKLTLMTQVLLPARLLSVVAQVLDCAKSVAPEVTAMLDNVTGAVPEFVTVTVFAAAVTPTCVVR